MRLLTSFIITLALIILYPSSLCVVAGLSIATTAHKLDGQNNTVGHATEYEPPGDLNPSNLATLYFDINNFADDAKWQTYIEKGHRLNCIMEATDAGAGFLIQDTRTPISAANDLDTWYWHGDDFHYQCNFEKELLGNVFNGLGMNAKSSYNKYGEPAAGDNDCYSLEHFEDGELLSKQNYIVDGKEYTGTGGTYEFAINMRGGGIFGRNLISPKSGAEWNWGRDPTPEELPKLRYCSDIYWNYWFLYNPNVKSLRVYGGINIVNDDTVLLVSRSLREAGKGGLSRWPGDSFDARSDAGKALIGSPIGATIANMLFRHKADLGIKHVSKVLIVTNDLPREPLMPGEEPETNINIFFLIEDVPAEDITDNKSEEHKAVRATSVRYVKIERVDGVNVHRFSN